MAKMSIEEKLKNKKALVKLKSAMKPMAERPKDPKLGTLTTIKKDGAVSQEVPPMVKEKEIEKSMEESIEFKNIQEKFRKNKKKYGN